MFIQVKFQPTPPQIRPFRSPPSHLTPTRPPPNKPGTARLCTRDLPTRPLPTSPPSVTAAVTLDCGSLLPLSRSQPAGPAQPKLSQQARDRLFPHTPPPNKQPQALDCCQNYSSLCARSAPASLRPSPGSRGSVLAPPNKQSSPPEPAHLKSQIVRRQLKLTPDDN